MGRMASSFAESRCGIRPTPGCVVSPTELVPVGGPSGIQSDRLFGVIDCARRLPKAYVFVRPEELRIRLELTHSGERCNRA